MSLVHRKHSLEFSKRRDSMCANHSIQGSSSSLLPSPVFFEANKDLPPCYLSANHSLSHLECREHTGVSLVCTATLHRGLATMPVQATLYSSSLYFRFERETKAYEILISAGATKNIQRVYGYMRWSSRVWKLQFPHISVYDNEVYALITERMDSSFVDTSSRNVNLHLAARAVTSLEEIHRAGILHGNICHHFFVNRDIHATRWVRFENCRLPGEHTPEDLEKEMQFAMELFYGYYVRHHCGTGVDRVGGIP
jgi:hypothetical protein